MSSHKAIPEKIKDENLRKKAEEFLLNNSTLSNDISPQEIQRLLHELCVHEVELEMQNEELRTSQIKIMALQENYYDLYDNAPVGYCTLDNQGIISEVNLTAATLLGISKESLFHQPISRFVFKEDQDIYYLFRKQLFGEDPQQMCELRMNHSSGEILWIHLMAILIVRNDGVLECRLTLSNISMIKNYQKKLESIAFYDALTTLPNRTLLSDRLNQAMIQAIRHDQPLAVIYLDLDGFKEINDAHGHDIGDQFLVILSQYIKEVMREGDTLARMGGDEFIAVLPDIASIRESLPMVKRLLLATAKSVYIDELVLTISGSLGITFFPQNEDVDADQLLRQADYAMYQAKLAGKNRYYVFDMAQNDVIRELYEIIERVQKGLNNDEFILYYQPKVNMKTGEIIGFEALIRWQHPNKGVLNPLDFLPEIEDNPLIIDIGEWVIERVLIQMEEWQKQGFYFHVSVNISARQLQDENFVLRLRELLSRHASVAPSYLEMEVLESSKLEDVLRTSAIIEECSKLGILFSLDDFGTGYSSLTYLKHLPVSKLKIDQSFISGMLENSSDLSILKGVIGLASAFHREVIAEGVETIEHGILLMSLGCNHAQGYAISPPIPAYQVLDWSQSWQLNPVWQD